MTTRNLTAGMLAAIAAGTVRPAVLYEGVFVSGGSDAYLRLWTGVGDLVWNSVTWTGGGQLLAISPLEEAAEVRAVGFSVTLSGMPSSLIANALVNARQGKPGKLYLALFVVEPYLSLPGISGNYASTPDSAAVDFSVAIDIAVDAQLDDWADADYQVLAAKDDLVTRGWIFFTDAGTGRLVLFVMDATLTPVSAISTVATGFAAGSRHWVRAVFEPAVSQVRFYASSEGAQWAQLGAAVAVGSASPRNTTHAVTVGAASGGSYPATGRIYAAIFSGTVGGAPAARLQPGHFTAAGTGVSATGEVWTLQTSGGTPARIVGQADLVADPYQLDGGRLDFTVIEDAGDTCTIAAQYESRLVDLERPRERRYTAEDQKIDYPADLGFDYVPSLQETELIWGAG